jgi:hypothetical protein
MGSMTWLKLTSTAPLDRVLARFRSRVLRNNRKRLLIQATETLEVRALLSADASPIAIAGLISEDTADEADFDDDWYHQPFDFDNLMPRAFPFDPDGLPARSIDFGDSLLSDFEDDSDGEDLQPIDPGGLPPAQPFDIDGLMPRSFDIDGLLPRSFDPFVSLTRFKLDEIFGLNEIFEELDDIDTGSFVGPIDVRLDLDFELPPINIGIGDVVDDSVFEDLKLDELDLQFGFTNDPFHESHADDRFLVEEFFIEFPARHSHGLRNNLRDFARLEFGSRLDQIIEASEQFTDDAESLGLEFLELAHFHPFGFRA